MNKDKIHELLLAASQARDSGLINVTLTTSELIRLCKAALTPGETPEQRQIKDVAMLLDSLGGMSSELKAKDLKRLGLLADV